MTRNIDELSNLTTQKAEPPKEYFGKMDLNEEQVEKRLQYTKKANELFDVILILLLTMNERGETNFFYAKSLLESWILSLVAEFTTPDDYLMDYATDTAYNFVDTTNKHIDEPWYTSSDRALYNAENGANDVLNYTEYKEAIEAGKTEKRWITEKDNRVRKSHKSVTQKPIPILEYFRVGMAQMRFPKDYEMADAFPEELINCRCTIEYLPRELKSGEFAEVTQEYIDNANPGNGAYTIEKGFENKNGELQTGNWLFSKFGGDLRFLAENNPDGTSNPDYLWRGKLWDLKTPEMPSGVDKLTRKGLHQIARNSGGIVMDVKNLDLTINQIESGVKKRIKSSAQADLDFILCNDNKLIKILRYKK